MKNIIPEHLRIAHLTRSPSLVYGHHVNWYQIRSIGGVLVRNDKQLYIVEDPNNSVTKYRFIYTQNDIFSQYKTRNSKVRIKIKDIQWVINLNDYEISGDLFQLKEKSKPLCLEVGKVYKRKNDQLFKIIAKLEKDSFSKEEQFVGISDNDALTRFYEDGRYHNEVNKDLDLIEEVILPKKVTITTYAWFTNNQLMTRVVRSDELEKNKQLLKDFIVKNPERFTKSEMVVELPIK